MGSPDPDYAARLEAERLRPTPRPVTPAQIQEWYIERLCRLVSEMMAGRIPPDPQGPQKCEHRKLWGFCKYPGCSSHVYDTETGQFLGYARIKAGGDDGS